MNVGRPSERADPSTGGRVLKKIFDIGAAGLIALVAAPIVLVLAAAGVAVWRANPFFVQDRVGRHGRTYRLLKLRSLPPEAPAYADKYAIGEVPIPAFGRILRKFHLDELPQIIHVLSGKMSLVGPRPEMAFLHEQMEFDFAQERVQVRPGVTGLWQVSQACEGLILESPEYDRAYLAARSLRLDAWILWRTVLKFLGFSPITLEDVPTWALSERDRASLAAAGSSRTVSEVYAA
jgi:lipopolysaccharide/colanic/teichoic acid biosynthesis glycosyltransferase